MHVEISPYYFFASYVVVAIYWYLFSLQKQYSNNHDDWFRMFIIAPLTAPLFFTLTIIELTCWMFRLSLLVFKKALRLQ